MSTKKILNIVGVILLSALVSALVVVSVRKAVTNVGGTFNSVITDFAGGITVGGTSVIDSSANVVGYSNGYSKQPVITPTADVTLTTAQSGSIVQMGVAGLDVTIPTPASSAGVWYTFEVNKAVATTNMTIVAGTADTIEGSMIVAGAVVDCDASDLITFVIDGENIGDFVTLYSDGTSWLIKDSGGLTASKMTCTG